MITSSFMTAALGAAAIVRDMRPARAFDTAAEALASAAQQAQQKAA